MIKQIYPWIFKKIMVEIEGLKTETEMERMKRNKTSQRGQQASGKHVKNIKGPVESHENTMWFIEKYQNDLFFIHYAYLVMNEIGVTMKILIDEIGK